MIDQIIDQINFHDLFVATITSNSYHYIEVWFEDGAIDFIARPQNEYAQNEDGLVARIKATSGENEFLFDGYATFSDGKYIIMETGEEINEDELIEDCLENGDWSMVYDDLENQIRDQYHQKYNIHNCDTLDELWGYLITHNIDDIKMDNLPNFGGEEPSDTFEVWSWDQTHILIGAGIEDLHIEKRTTNN